MSVFRECPYHRVTESIGMGRGLGYCDLDGSQTICDGDTKFCGKPDILGRYLFIRILEKRLWEVDVEDALADREWAKREANQ